MTDEARLKANKLSNEIEELNDFISRVEYFIGEKRCGKKIEKKKGILSIFCRTPVICDEFDIPIPLEIQKFLSQELCNKARECVEHKKKEIEEL